MLKFSAAIAVSVLIATGGVFAAEGTGAVATDANSAGAAASPNATGVLSGHDLLHQLDDAFVGVFEKVAPSVVIIDADKKAPEDEQDQSFDYYFHEPEGGAGDTGKDDGGKQSHVPDAPSVRSEGSGFIVRADGYIYTNYHVIADADKITVKLRDHRHFDAKVVGGDERTDIAVLKIDATDLPAVTMMDSDEVRVGQMCFAIGIPYDLDYSFCHGLVSATGRGNLTATATKPMYEDYIQTDAFINPGNSGGPLFDIDGRVMGMNTLINGQGRGLSFSIPSDMLNDVGQELIANGRAVHAWLGVVVQNREDVPSGAYADQGVEVAIIEADTPAYKSDLRAKDVIVKVDGVPVMTSHDLQHEIQRKKVGEKVALSVERGKKSLEITVVTDKMPDDLGQVAQNHVRAKKHPSDATNYGLEFAEVTAPAGGVVSDPKASKDSKANAGGVLITNVDPDSPAGRAGIQAGDILTAVDQRAVTDPGTCQALLAGHRGTTGPILFITRNGHKGSAVLDTEGAEKQ
jgi:serine protease Do